MYMYMYSGWDNKRPPLGSGGGWTGSVGGGRGGVGQIVTPSLIMGGRWGGGWADPVGELVTPPLIIIPSGVHNT